MAGLFDDTMIGDGREFMQTFVLPIARAAQRTVHSFHEMLGQDDIKEWEVLPDDVKAAWLSMVVFLSRNPSADATLLHEHWVAFKQADGWKYSDTKDFAAKTNPAMKPYDELSDEQRYKYHLVINTFKALSTDWTDFSNA